MLGPYLTFVNLGDGREQLRGTPAILTDEVAESMEQLSFREVCK